MAQVWRKRTNLIVTADGAGTELVSDEPFEEASQSRSRKPRENRGAGPQRLRARVVLRRIWREGYPTRAEVSDVDAWDRFSKEYEKVEGKANPPSRYGKPSLETVLREMGRKD
jgi:hypothetical protein